MARTVFWSWQSDRDERVTRHLIREALVLALGRLTGDADIEERLEIDHDTRGLPGSPDIVTSILAKIDAAAVFVADVTPIAISDGGKHVANPNVLIELGYAKKALGVDRVVTVWNTAFTHSRFEDLPFDLRGRRGPITYALEAGASREELGKARAGLVDGFVDRIGTCLDSIPLPIVASPAWHPASQSDRSLWIEPGAQFRVNEDFGSGNKAWAQGGRWYLRVLPRTFDPSTLDGGAHGPFVGGYGGYSWGNVTGGVLTYSGSVRADVESELDAASMWFRSTGEIWTAQTRIGADWKGRPCFFGDHIPEKWADLLDGSLKRLHESGGGGPFRVRLGVTGLEGLFWPDVQTFGGEPPAALEPGFETEFEVAGATPDDWRAALVEAWTALRRIFSLPPPKTDLVEETMRNATR